MPNFHYIKADDPLVTVLKHIAIVRPPGQPIDTIARNPRFQAIPMAALRYLFGPVLASLDGRLARAEDRQVMAQSWPVAVRLERIEMLCGERPDLLSPTELFLALSYALGKNFDGKFLPGICVWAADRAIANVVRYPDLTNFRGGLLAEIMHKQSLPFRKIAAPATDEMVFGGDSAAMYQHACGQIMEKVISTDRELSGLAFRLDGNPAPDEDGLP